jgi:hypothetical protein
METTNGLWTASASTLCHTTSSDELTHLSHWVQLKDMSYSEATDIICESSYGHEQDFTSNARERDLIPICRDRHAVPSDAVACDQPYNTR